MKIYNSEGVCDECRNHTDTYIVEFDYTTIEICKNCSIELTNHLRIEIMEK